MRKQNMILSIAGVLLLVSAILFIYSKIVIPNIKKNVEMQVRTEFDDKVMPKKKVAVVDNSDDIKKYTLLSDDILSKIKIVDIPVKYANINAVSSLDELKNKITLEDLRNGEQISLDSISANKKQFSDYDRMKEYPIRSIVAGEVKAGNYIDVIVNYNNGDYDVVAAKKQVLKLIETSVDPNNSTANQQVSPTNNNAGQASNQMQSNTPSSHPKEYTMIIAVNEQQYRDMELAKQIGSLETRLYFDEAQPSSNITFNYESALKKAELKVTNEKANQSVIQPGTAPKVSSSSPTLPQDNKKLSNPVTVPAKQSDNSGAVFVRPQN